jgi:prepilin-type N-terminal cleavage/methylation domain-containing protein
MPRQHAGRAFSLLELILALVLVAAILAIAAPRYARALSEYQARIAAQRVAQELRGGLRAAERNDHAVFFAADVNADTLRTFGPRQRPGPADDPIDLTDPPFRARIVASDCNRARPLRIDPAGRVARSVRITVKAGIRRQEIALNPDTGRVTILP